MKKPDDFWRFLQILLSSGTEFLFFTMNDIDTSEVLYPLSFPLMIETNNQRYADKLLFEISKKVDLPIKFINLNSSSWQKELALVNDKTIAYLIDYHILKRNVKDQLIKLISNKNAIICTLESDPEFTYKKIHFNNSNSNLDNTQILTINDYVKMIVSTYQNKYPDTELSKRLGISRKSLWEKRKKLEIDKKK